jgi:hypothetical protein
MKIPDQLLKPAMLMRRMPAPEIHAVTLSAADSDPLLRLAVEATRGRITLNLAKDGIGDAPIQWTQNGTPLKGQTNRSLLLAELGPDDSDVYYALIGSGNTAKRSQSALIVVLPGHAILNYSARAHVGPGQPLIAGWVVTRGAGAPKNKNYLIRAIGPELKKFGVVTPVAQPSLALFRRGAACCELLRTNEMASAQAWGAKVGAFALATAESEFVALAELAPGAYSVVVNGDGRESGEVLLEIYELPA